MPKDFITTELGAPAFLNGDLMIDESTIQHQGHLLVLDKGDIKQHPTAGIGVARYLKDDEVLPLLGETKRECEADGMAVDLVSITDDGNLKLEAVYGY